MRRFFDVHKSTEIKWVFCVHNPHFRETCHTAFLAYNNWVEKAILLYVLEESIFAISLFIAPQILSCHLLRNNLHNILLRVTMQTL